MSTVVAETHHRPRTGLRDGAFGNATGLACRECGHQRRARPALRLSGVLRPARGRLRLPGGHPRADRGRAPQHLALQGAAAGARRHRAEPQHRARLHPAAQGRQPRPRARHRRTCGSRTTRPTRRNSFKDRVVACALSAARELGAKVFACPSTGNLANAVAAAGARAGIKTVVFIPQRPRAAQAGQLRGLHRLAGRRRTATTTTSTGSPRRSPARRRAGRSSTSTSGPTTPRAPRRWATRSPSSSAGGCPTRS